MRIIAFNKDEYIVMAMFEAENRQATIGKIEEILPFIQKDAELVKIGTGTIEKMTRMQDEKFAQLDM